MADVVDAAVAIEAETLARGIARASAPLRAGAAGECDGCDWWMPRLVDGLCGFCRDGRARPPDWEPPVRPDQPTATPDVSPTSLSETPVMASTPGSKSITFVASGEVLAEIKRRTDGGEVSNNRAALDLIEAGMRARPIAESVEARTPRQRLVALLDGVSDLLIEQIDAAASPAPDTALIAERDDWKARAEAAEGRLAQMRALFA